MLLLSADDPPPFRVERAEGASPFFLCCDHAGRIIPRVLETLGLGEEDLARHIAWDIGARGVMSRLAVKLDAFAIAQTYSRLVIDCNRPLDAKDSIAVMSERTRIIGNEHVSAEDAERRRREIFHPYQDRIRAELDARDAISKPTVLVSVHSFTPVFMDAARAWHAGVLYNRDPRLGRALLALLREDAALVVGDNEPYALRDSSDYTVPIHGEKRGILHVEIEMRQDLIAHEQGQEEWATRLASLLPKALARAT